MLTAFSTAQVQAFTDVELSLQRAVTNSIGSRDRSMTISLESISEADSNAVKHAASKQSRLCHSDTPQPVRVMAAGSVRAGKPDAVASDAHVAGRARQKPRPRGNALPAAAAADMYSFAAVSGTKASATPDLYSFAAAPAARTSAEISVAAAESRASSRRNSLQSMSASAERNNPYASLASCLGGVNATDISGVPADSFASAGARVGGKPMPSMRPTVRPGSLGDSFASANARVGTLAMPSAKPGSRLAVRGSVGGSFATAGARVGGLAMPQPAAKQSITEGSSGVASKAELQQGTAAATGVDGSAAEADKVASPFESLLSVGLSAARLPTIPSGSLDSEVEYDLTSLSAPLPAAAPQKGAEDQPPPNPFASSAKRSEPLLDGWRQRAA